MSTEKKIPINGLSRREFLRLTGLTSAAVVITSCTPKTTAPTTAPESGAAPTEAAAEQVERTLVCVAPATPPGLDLDVYGGNEYGFFMCNLYDPIFTYKSIETDTPGVYKCDVSGLGDATIEGALAESWEKVDDITYLVHLRKGVKSYYGNEMTANDFKWRVDRAFGTNGSGTFQIKIAGMNGPEDVTVVDDYTLKMVTSQGPSPRFFKALAIFSTGCIDSTEAKKHTTSDDPWALDWFVQNSAGFGPYHVEEFTAGEQVVLVKNPGYYKDLYFDKIIWKAVPESTTRLALLESGDAHYADSFITYEQANEIKNGKGEAILRTVTPDNQENFLEFNPNMPPFTSKLVRQAMAYAVPYDDILNSVYLGFGAAGFLVPPFYPDSFPETWTYKTDLEKAKQLWDESGEIKEFSLAWDSGIADHEKDAILIQTNLAKIGVKVTLDKMSGAVFADKCNKAELPAFIVWKASWAPDVSHQGYVNWHSESFFNFKNYKNPEVDDILSQTTSILDSPERTRLHKRLQEVLADDVPSINLCYRGWIQAINKNIVGLQWYLDSYPRFAKFSMKEG